MLNHRSYQSILPTHNKLLQKRWDSTYYEEHRRRIMSASHMVSTNAPKQHPHVANKLKKQQRESERSEVVQRDNDTLMVHMSAIMEKASYVDHRNDYKHWSLNYEKRVNEMQRIQKENIKMLGRIQSRPANYKVSEWLKDRSEKERLISMITAHPSSHQTKSARPSAVRERNVYSHSCLLPFQIESGSLTTLEPSVSDTVESLEKELEAARIQIDKYRIEKKVISEVKSINKPPILFVLVLEACAILFNQQGDKRDSLWCVGYKALARNYLVRIDRGSIPLSVLKKLQFYIENPKVNEEALKCVSLSIGLVWKWVESVYHYGVLAHKYGILAEEMGIGAIVQQESMAAEPSPVVKEKKEKTFASLELSETDTIESLKIELEIARSEFSNCVLNKYDIVVLKSMAKPPALIKLVLEACGIIFNQKKGVNLWRLGLQSLVQSNAASIDLDNIRLSVLKKLRQYIEEQDITHSRLKQVSTCLVSVWKWVESVYHYGIVAHKYGILAEEMGIGAVVQQESMTAEPSPVVKEKKEKLFASLELSETDTIESLKIELEIARSKFSNCVLNKNDIVVLKSMAKPPALIKLVLEACGILFNQKGVNLWRLGLQSLVQSNAASIDLDNIPLSVLKKLRQYIEEQDITQHTLEKVSLSIVSVWKWVESVYHYGIVAHKLDQLNTNNFSKGTS